MAARLNIHLTAVLWVGAAALLDIAEVPARVIVVFSAVLWTGAAALFLIAHKLASVCNRVKMLLKRGELLMQLRQLAAQQVNGGGELRDLLLLQLLLDCLEVLDGHELAHLQVLEVVVLLLLLLNQR